MKLNLLKNAEEFLKLKSHYIISNDVDICMVNGGNTQYKKITENEYETFSSGVNWNDQQSEIQTHEYMIKKIYRNRKNINLEIESYENFGNIF